MTKPKNANHAVGVWKGKARELGAELEAAERQLDRVKAWAKRCGFDLSKILEDRVSLPTTPGSLIVVDDLPHEDGPVTLVLHDEPGPAKWYYLTGTSYYLASRIERECTWHHAQVTFGGEK